MGFSHVIPQLTKKILNKNNNNILIANSNHKRTFCYIDFAIELILTISHVKKSSKKYIILAHQIKIFQLCN